MTYETFEEKISAYLDDELNPVERLEMERKPLSVKKVGLC